MNISNISPERDVNNKSTMTEEVNISLNKLFNLSAQEFGNIISKHKLRLRVCFSSSSYAQRATSNFTKPYSLHVNLYEISDSVRRTANFAYTPFIPIRAVLH